MDALSTRIADRIRTAVEEARITHAEFAQVLDVSETTVGRRLRGERPYEVTEIVKAVEFLKIDIGDLFGTSQTLAA